MFNPYEQSDTLLLREIVRKAEYEAKLEAAKTHRVAQSQSAPDQTASSSNLSTSSVTGAAAGGGGGTSNGKTPEEALHAIFPPQAVGLNDEGSLMVFAATTKHTAKMDVINLQEQLERRCEAANARAFGVDPAREGLYGDCMDEVTRQVAKECPERGLLMSRLVDEQKETTATYDLLLEASAQFASRKALERDLKRTMEQKLEDVTVETHILENRVNEIKAKYEGIEKRIQEQRVALEKKHQEEVNFLKKGNQQLTMEIKRLTA